MFFFSSGGVCCNLVPLDEIPKRFEKIAANAEKYGFEVFCVGSHEQYTFPYYPNYLPDHIRAILAGIQADRSAVSKYVLCRRFEPLDR